MPPEGKIELTSRDLEILEVLTQRVRVLSLEQIARTWWPKAESPTKLARQRIGLLADSAGLLVHFLAPAHPEIPLSEPVVSWRPGDPDPDMGAASYRLKSRWRKSPIPTFFTSASKKAANRFGGHGGRIPLGTHRTHDLHLAAVFLLIRLRDAGEASSWISEERIRHARDSRAEKLPDAVVRTTQASRVIEFGGAYPKKKLEAFHEHCLTQALPYEVW